ncbi:hypothetical protein BJ944DRAFT_169925 [Cunninghamella echinulata]|nr:hypothetical protein BJ944DRAFT_169925 [Cunninghamella echinulata]
MIVYYLYILFFFLPVRCDESVYDGVITDDGEVIPRYDYGIPKKIGFSAVGGGSSHFFWVLEILDELANRGHHVTLYTRKDSLKYAEAYPKVHARQVGGDESTITKDKDAKISLLHNVPNPMNTVNYGIPSLLKNYTNEYKELESVLKKDKVDLMFCDMFAFQCMDATVKSNLPLVLTSTMAYTPDAQTYYTTVDIPSLHHPTIETQTIYQRLKYFFYKQYMPYKLKQSNLPAQQFQQQQLGLAMLSNLYNENANQALKLVNNIFGLEPARPLGPLVEMIGPIMKKTYEGLTPEIKQFLSSHSKIVYVAFGQHSVPTREDTDFIMKALVNQLENGLIDGIYWASSPKHPTPNIPSSSSSTSSSNNDNSSDSMKNKNKQRKKINPKDILITSWAPQFAILQHPSTFMFVTHGGAASLHECLFSKVIPFVYPFFGDQPLSARRVRQLNIGDYIDTAGMDYTLDEFNELTTRISHILTDPTIYQNVQLYSRAVQLRSKNAVQRGADSVEELLYSAHPSNGHMNHRIDVIFGLEWYKKYNLDLIFLVAIFPLLTIFYNSKKKMTQKKSKTL